MEAVYIGIGSNLGNRRKNILRALSLLNEAAGIEVARVSSFIESEPWGYKNQPKYLNCAAKLKVNISAQELLEYMLGIENALGRKRTFKNAPRIIDLDILLFGDKIINQPGLTIPHPRMFERDFVLKPLLEIEPDIDLEKFKNVNNKKTLSGLRNYSTAEKEE